MFSEGDGEGERETERNTDVREKHQLVASHTCPDQGLSPQPRYVPCPGIKPATFGAWFDAVRNWAT